MKQRPSVTKRIKERTREEKKQRKAERRAQRKQERDERDTDGIEGDPDLAGIVPGPQAPHW